MYKGWKKESARDILALGGWIFYALVAVRAVILPDKLFFIQLLITGMFLILTEQIYKKYDAKIARGLVLAVFTSLYYNVILYGVFVSMLYVFMIWCSKYSGRKWSGIIKGIAVGLIGAGSGYYFAGLIV